MTDSARSDHRGVQTQLDRLGRLSPGRDELGLERITHLLERLGRPDRRLPPVFHVAGTNGKGSTCAFLRAAIEAAGLNAHIYTSPHLVRFNERIRLNGRLIDDEALADLLGEVLDQAEDMQISFFEATTAAAFLAFSREPAEASVIEVGLGGRLDATNVIEHPNIGGIAQLGMDHHAFLGDRLELIAAEKAGIAKEGVPLVTLRYPAAIAEVVGRAAAGAKARWLPQGEVWDYRITDRATLYWDQRGTVNLPRPKLAGDHQCANGALAVAMIRHQQAVEIGSPELKAAMGWASWPARLQRLTCGPLVACLPSDAEAWLDGAHNPNAAAAVADFFRAHVPANRPFHLIAGLLANKDAKGVFRRFQGRSLTLHAVPVPEHEHHAPDRLAAEGRALGMTAMTADDVAGALRWIGRHSDPAKPPIVLIMGSLYLAGQVLRANDQLPD